MKKNLQDYGLNTLRPTYVIAEIGLNHNGDLSLAKKLIESAAQAGADAVKFQTYISEKRVPPSRPDLLPLFKKLELPFPAFIELQACAKAAGVHFFSTPFDRESVDFLEGIGCDLYKVASFDIVNRQLLSRLALTGKPIILSVGMASLDEVRTAYEILRQGTRKIVLLHCVSAYPTPESDAHLSNIRGLEREFDCVIGQSDHTADITVPLYAAAAGAQVLEKHFRLNGQLDCVDAPVSIDADQLSRLVREVRRLESIMGSEAFGVRPVEAGTSVFRRPSS